MATARMGVQADDRMMVAVSGIRLRRIGSHWQVLGELSDGWRLLLTVHSEARGEWSVDVEGILAAPEVEER